MSVQEQLKASLKALEVSGKDSLEDLAVSIINEAEKVAMAFAAEKGGLWAVLIGAAVPTAKQELLKLADGIDGVADLQA